MNVQQLLERVERESDRLDEFRLYLSRRVIGALAAVITVVIIPALIGFYALHERVAVLENTVNNVKQDVHDLEEEPEPEEKGGWFR